MDGTAANGRNLAMDQWPGTLMQYELPTSIAPLIPKWRKCPMLFAELTNFAFFTFNPNADQPYSSLIFAHRGWSGNDHVAGALPGVDQVTLRVQGTLKRIHMDSLGNWNGGLDEAEHAEQSFSLTGEVAEPVFAQQTKAVQSIAHYAEQALDPSQTDKLAAGILRNAKEILFRRRLFTQVTTDNMFMPRMKSVVTPDEDPLNRTALVHGSWRIVNRMFLTAHPRRGNPHVETIPVTALADGDFVEVDAHLEIDMKTNNAGFPELDIRLEPLSIHRVARAAEVADCVSLDVAKTEPPHAGPLAPASPPMSHRTAMRLLTFGS
ncbi:hypothetical protein FA95DRAFT_1577361 [Auriscalpium vulgare]|uniref:Uncharacterized protein n=1 Tax=Auriscalpium vulgare TaxID=40419 RepID=A0ACB8R897_9AGAM|nr:hypothetical protein FA95DRAFT_1577361 [Auriscalpium vulgare]